MRFATIFAAAAAIATTGASATNITFIDGLINQLTSLNLTSLVGAATTIANTTAGAALFAELSSGQPTTLFAPNNAAFAGVNPYFGNDPTWLGQALAYHVVPGTAISDSTVAASPNSTVYPTALKDTSIVHLIGEKPQNIALTNVGGNITFISNQNYPSRVVKTTTYQNIVIHVVSAVIDLPPSFTAAISDKSQTYASELSTLATLVPPSFSSLLSTSPSVTIFAPNNAAITTAISKGRLSANTSATTIHDILLNHVINGTLVFSGKGQTDYISAGGETITVGTGGFHNGNVVYYKGELVANIISSDVILQNGVLHIIDAVLPNAANNEAAASSAFGAYSVSATATGSAAKRTLAPSRLFGKRRY